MPKRLLVLGSGRGGVLATRSASRVLVLRPEGGFLLPRGRALPGEEAHQSVADPGYLLSLFDGLYRASPVMSRGARIALRGLTIEVTALTPDGRPAEASFTFDRDLADPSLRWLRFEDGVYVPFPVPAVGGSVGLAPVANPFR
jgi:hypothetical protein